MALRDLPLLRGHKGDAGKPDLADAGKPDVTDDAARGPGPTVAERAGREGTGGPYGAAHARPRDAYRDVPILQRPTWGADVAAYFYLGGISAGAFTLGALAAAVGGPRRESLARTAHYVAFAAMLPCPPLLIADLGRRSRFHHMLRIFKPSSPMNLGAWTLTAHGAMATITVLRQLAGEGKLPVLDRPLALLPERALAVGGLPTALTLGGYTGVLLGTTSVPVWSTSPLLGGLFTASALSTGAAATSLASVASGRDDPAGDRALSVLRLALGASEAALLGGYLATSGRAAAPLLRGRSGLMLASSAGALVAAGALEAAGMAVGDGGGKRLLSAAAAGATLLGGGLLRWAVVHAGHASAADREGTLEATQPSPGAPGWGNSSQAQ